MRVDLAELDARLRQDRRLRLRRGGTLSHAAIVGREYGVPTVTAVGLATMLISDGDEVEVEWVLDRHRRAGDPVCVVQARPVTVVNPVTDQAPAEWNPVAMAAKYAFGS